MIENINEQQKTIDLILQQAIALHSAGQLGQAEQLYRRILQTYPNHPGAHHNLGLIAAQTGNHGPSLKHFAIALEGAPDHVPTILNYANAQMNNGYLLDAMKTVKAARQRGLDSPELKAAQRTIDDAIAYSISNPSPTSTEWEPLYKLAREQKWSEVETKAQKLGEKYPKAGKLWKLLAMALEAQGKPSLMVKRKAANLAPADMELQFNLANQLYMEGHVDESENVLKNAVTNNPGSAQAHCNLGIYLNNLGRVLESGTSLRRALELDPGLIQAHCALAVLLQKSGQIDEAKACCQRALTVYSNSPDVICVLGMTLYGLGEFDEAGKQFNRALVLNPLHIESMINLGNTLRVFGMNDDAKKCYYRAIEVQPQSALAHNNLGVMLHNDGEYKNAITCYQRAIANAPNYVNAYDNLGNTLLQIGAFVDAAEVFKRALTYSPNSVVSLCGLGAALQGLGQLHDALQCFLKAQQLDPKFAINYCNLSSIYGQLGQVEEAQEAIKKGLSLDPADPRILSQALALIPYKADDPHFAQLESIYDRRERLGVSDRISLCMAYGRAMEAAGEYDKSFKAYQEGNRLHYQLAPFDEALCRAQVESICNIMTVEKIAALTEAAKSLPAVDDPRVPVFIVGMPRSGSTLLEQILASHPQVHSAGELTLLGNLLVGATEKLAQAAHDVNATVLALREIGKVYLDQVWKLSPEARVITDKMLTNFFHIGQIKLMLPQAKIVHAVRDPLDTCFSGYALRFAGGHEYTYDLEVLGRFYKDYERLMQHWRQVLPAGSVLDMEYEKNVVDLEQETRRMLDFIGLPWDDACLKFFENKRLVATSSLNQVRKPIYQSSVARAKPYESHLQGLIKILEG